MEFLTRHTTANNSVLKIVAAILFITFPVIGFVLGMQYQAIISLSNQYYIVPQYNTSSSVQKVDQSINWKTYKNDNYGFELKYPDFFYIKEQNYSFSWGKDIVGIINKNFNNYGQPPTTQLSLFYTDKSIDVFMNDSYQESLKTHLESIKNYTNYIYKNKPNPELKFIKDIDNGSIKAKVYISKPIATAPYSEETQYVFKGKDEASIFILSAPVSSIGGTPNEQHIDGKNEIYLDAIFKSFRFLN